MFDPEEGQDQIAEAVSAEADVHSPEAETTAAEPDAINPVWEPLRQELGAQFEIIKPHLLEIDKGYNKGITSANEKFTPWKQFADSGITPDVVTKAFATLQQFDQNPEQAYLALGAFLEKNGRLPKNAAEAAQAVEDQEAADDELTEEQKELKALREEIEGFRTYQQAEQQQREQQQLDQQAEQSVQQEYDEFDTAHPGLDPAMKKEILQRHYLYAAAGPESMKTLEQVFAEVDGLRKSFLTAPRPNDTAPRLPGTGGGVPTGETKKVDEYSRTESQDLLAALVSQASKN